MNEQYEEVLGWCKKYIETEFAPCGLKDAVERRILELVQVWKEKKAKGILKNGKMLIFRDIHRAVWKAKADSKKFGKHKCEYFRKWLSIPFTKPRGLGHWTLRMWGQNTH
jgi:hypothetical protein